MHTLSPSPSLSPNLVMHSNSSCTGNPSYNPEHNPDPEANLEPRAGRRVDEAEEGRSEGGTMWVMHVMVHMGWCMRISLGDGYGQGKSRQWA